LEKACKEILLKAKQLASKEKANLTVQVFANPPMLCVPYHSLPIDWQEEDEPMVFGEQCTFVLRSRARLTEDERYDLESWRLKVKSLTEKGCQSIALEPAPEWAKGVGDKLAKVDGMLVIRELLELNATNPQKLLNIALRKGLPLLTWRTDPPPNADWTEFDKSLKSLLANCASVDQAPSRLKERRKSEPWARQTALFWDAGDDPAFLTEMIEDPAQE
jgi:hypothetical protein